jgi:predicted nucleotidyltransferase
MRLEYYPADKLKKEILEILGKYLDLSKYKVFFFGSRVSGSGDSRSDIDIGIEGPEIPAYTKLEIEEELENLPILYKIDFVDFNNVSDKFKKVAKEHIEYLN